MDCKPLCRLAAISGVSVKRGVGRKRYTYQMKYNKFYKLMYYLSVVVLFLFFFNSILFV